MVFISIAARGGHAYPRLPARLDPASAPAAGLLIFALAMVVTFEATNGFDFGLLREDSKSNA
jgi:hypothetical protein